MHFWVEELGQELYNEDSSCSEGTGKIVNPNEIRYSQSSVNGVSLGTVLFDTKYD